MYVLKMRVTSDKKSNYCLTLKGYRESFAFGEWGSFKCAPPFFFILLVFLFSFSALRGNIAQDVRSQRPWHGAGMCQESQRLGDQPGLNSNILGVGVEPGLVVHTLHTSTQQRESLCKLKGQPGLHSETCLRTSTKFKFCKLVQATCPKVTEQAGLFSSGLPFHLSSLSASSLEKHHLPCDFQTDPLNIQRVAG